MTCPSCGTANTEGSAFCANCGAGLAAASVATAPEPGASGGLPPVVMEPGGDELLEKVKQHLGGDYSIEKELGRGGMAVVYKGVERALERVVAIKVVPPESANAGQAAERFRREARLAASLDHPNIIPVYRVGQAGPLHYMAMKFVEGRAVDAIIESQGALPLPVAIAILRYSAAGLAFAHEKKIVHRDIKGANILVDKDGRVMVSDFGIARALEEVSLTASGMVIGTPYYMSPEQCGGQKISPQSDQYSLGVMGFQMLTGEVPFNADSMVGVIQHHYMTPVPDIRAVRQDVPQELLDIIYCSLNKAPEDRFTTTREMAQALENVPQSDQDREEAERLLRELSAGKAIPKVRTGTLPPLTLTISGPAAPVVPRPVTQARRPQQAAPARPRRKKKKKNKLLIPATIGFIALASAGLWMTQQQKVAKQQEAAAAAAARIGTIQVVGLPSDSAQVLIQGRTYQNGDYVTLDSGTYPAQAFYAGYQPLISNVTINPGDTAVVELTMEPTQATIAANTQQGSAPILGPQAPANRGGNTPAAVADSGELRLTVTPNHVDIWVDGVKVGTGRKFYRTRIGDHQVRFSALNCVAETVPLRVTKTEPTVYNANVRCQ
ncbi:MAG TPA: protein kinase [Gemmatimonadaceae bacterium]|nr:protein kinase [Gemmatimonadaceae bacterium]